MRYLDFIVNVILPIFIGYVLYLYMPYNIIRYYLPDALWAFSFTSCLLIIWERKINVKWMLSIIILSPLFELMQHNNMIKGTGDIFDIIIYYFSFSIALIINHIINLKKHNHEN